MYHVKFSMRINCGSQGSVMRSWIMEKRNGITFYVMVMVMVMAEKKVK